RRDQLADGRGIARDDLDLQLWLVPGELRQQARQQVDRNARIGRDREVTAPPGPDLGRDARRVLCGFEGARRLDIEQLGFRGRLQPAAAAQEQIEAGLVLEA